MEPWQINHVNSKLPELIDRTHCNTDLLSRLISRKILHKSDIEDLDTIPRQTDKNLRLFQILMTRKAYFELIEVLHENGQTDPCEILWRAAIHHKKVKFQTKDTNLGDIFSRFNTPIPEGAENLGYDLIKQDIPILVNSSVRASPKYYIKRRISRSRRISQDIFQTPGNDVFVLTGLQRYELTKLANGMDTDVSSNQTNNLTVQFIDLELDSHFEKICSNATFPVHLIEYSADKNFNWIKSKGSVEKIRNFVQDEEVQMSETEFIKACLQSNRPVCIADSPGMGKSFMLTKMAQTIMIENPFHLVRFLQFTDFLVKLKQPVTQDSVCNAIAELSSDYKIGHQLVSKSLKSDEKLCYLFFDGFDEISPNQVPIVAEILTQASNLKQARVFVATRLHMRQQLEDIIGGLGFTLLPFRDEEQIEFLVKFWSDGASGSTKKLLEFARMCLENLKSVIGDQNIAGIPLVCSIIGRIYQIDAVDYSTSQLCTPVLTHTVSSIFQMYQRLMSDGFDKLTKMRGYNFKNSIRLKRKVKTHLIRLAVEELFPEWKEKPFLSEIGDKQKSLLFLPGILEYFSKAVNVENSKTLFRFVHRTFAEYLVAEFIAEGIKLPSTGVIVKIVAKILPKPRKFDNPLIKELVWKLMFKNVLATRVKHDAVHLKIGGRVKVSSYEFEQPTICYFLDSLLKSRGATRVSSEEIQSTGHQYHFVKMYTAAVVNDKPAIGKLLSGIFKSQCENLPWSELFLLAAKYAGVEMTRQLNDLCQHVFGKLPAELQYPESQQLVISPLHIAVQRGNYNLFEFLWNKSGFQKGFYEGHKNVQYILHECVSGTFLETLEVVKNKLQIINLILSDSGGERKLETITEESLPRDGSTPLLQRNIHVKVFKCLISKGAQLTHNNQLENALHISAINGNLPVAEFLITNHSALVHMSDKRGNTPLHLAFLNGTSQHVAIQLKLIDVGTDIYLANEKGCNPFINGMKYGKGLEMKVMKAIQSRHPQFLSAFGGFGLKSLLTNSNLMVWNWDKSLEEIAEYLIAKGAVLKCRKVETPWGLEQVGSNMREIVGTTEFTRELLQKLHQFGVFNKNMEISDKQTPFEILREAQGSYEKLMVSLMMCKQMKPFFIMKQCLQADDNESVWFVTPPPGVLDFIVDQEARVFILQTYNCQYSAIRIRDTVYPDLDVEKLKEVSKERRSVIFCPQKKLNEMLTSLLSFGTKTICIVNDTVTLAQIDKNDIKFVRTAFDEIRWNDLAGTVRTKLTSPLVDLSTFVNDFFRIMRLEVESKYKNCADIFKTKDINYSELEISPKNVDLIVQVDYFIALMVVNKKYRVYLEMERFVKFVESVVFKCKNESFVNSKICEYVNLLLKTCEVHAFKELLDKLDEVSAKNLVLGSVKSNYLEILKVFVTSRKSGDDKCGIVKRTMGSVIMNGNFESVAYIYDLYANLNKCLIVEYNEQFWLPLRLVARRRYYNIVEHIIQHHGYDLEPDNYLLVKKLISMKARIIKSPANQLIVALKKIVPKVIRIIKSRNKRLLYVAITFGTDVCAQDEYGYTMLHWAPQYLTPLEYHEFVVYLIQSNMTECFKVLDKWGVTILHRAVFILELLPETLDLIKSQNFDFNAITDENTENGSSVLHWAVEGNRNDKVIQKLFECGANVEASNKNGNGLLHYAAQFGNVSAIPLLMSLGCSVKSVNKYKSIPLHHAFFNTGESLVDVVRLLVEHDSDVNAKGVLGRTPLHSAVEWCKSLQVVNAIRFLIASGANVDIQDNEGNTMLLVRLTNRTPFDYHQIVQIIEKASSACLEKRDNHERTTVHRAVWYLEIQRDTLKLLIKYVGINAVNKQGSPPLFYAIMGGRTRKTLIMMIEHGADPKMRNNYQSNALHWASMYGNIPALEYFLERGEIGVNEKNKGGDTPLHYAFKKENGHVHEVVRLLIKAGGDLNVKNKSGMSPLDLAVEGRKLTRKR